MPEVDVILPIVPHTFCPDSFRDSKLSAPIDFVPIGFVCEPFLFTVNPFCLPPPLLSACLWSCYIAFPLSLLGMVQYTNVLLFRIKHCSKNMTSLSEYNGVLFLLNFFFLQSVQVGNITVSASDPPVVKIS